MDGVPWRQAWQQALYGPGGGFYVAAGGPAAHFTTATHGPTGAALARALLALPGAPAEVVVDVGAGRGELAAHLVAAGAGRVVAVDVVERPEGLDERVEWWRSPGGSSLPDALDGLEDALVVAHEWLDVVPCTVAEVDDAGTLREVLVDPATGVETSGEPLGGDELAWAEAHWPATTPGARVEVGLHRDRAWADLVARVTSGVLVAVDYGHVAGARPDHGTLVGYASGRLTTPVPDGTCDVTAHVAMDTLDADEVLTQRRALHRLGVTGARPPVALAGERPTEYLAALAAASAEGALLDPGGFGAFHWAVKRVGGRNVRW